MNPMEMMLLNQLRNKNPQAYNTFMQLKNSGKTPEQVLNELIANGTFTPDQVEQARNSLGNNNINNNVNTNIKRF